MDANLLVVSTNPQFGHLIQHSLTQGGVYQVQLCQSAVEAYARARQTQFHLAILDLESADPEMIALGRRFQQGSVKLPLIVFPPGNDPGSPLLEDVRAQAYLMKPFYLPEMAETVEGLLQPRSAGPTVEPDASSWQFFLTADFNFALLPWINDRDEAAAYITTLAQDSGAEAALIIQHGVLSGYAGRLEQDSAEKITALIQPRTDQPEVDSARFISLPGNQQTFLVYSTSLVGDLILGLVYDTSTPLSRIRSQANQISSNPAGAKGEIETAPGAENEAGWMPEETELPAEIEPEAVIPAVAMERAAEIMDEEETIELEEALPVTPSAEVFQEAWIPDIAPELVEPTVVSDQPQESRDAQRNVEIAENPPVTVAETDEDSAGLEPDGTAVVNLPDQPTPEVESFLTQPDQGIPPVDSLADTSPRLYPATSEIQPYAAPGLSNLTYTGVFVPRLPGHYLVGELAERLAEAVANACLGFGWNLEGLAVRPDHIEWIIRASPATAPARIIAALRRYTSEQIFMHTPELKEENPSGDFWSLGYLVISGAHTLPANMLQQYITETRQRQGITTRRSPENA